MNIFSATLFRMISVAGFHAEHMSVKEGARAKPSYGPSRPLATLPSPVDQRFLLPTQTLLSLLHANSAAPEEPQPNP